MKLKAKYIIGTDPGQSGAIAVIDSYSGTPIEVIDTPLLGGEADEYALIDFLRKYQNDSIGVIEKCQYTPAIRGKGAYTFGKIVGVMEMAFIATGIRREFVRPQIWKKEFELIKKEKDASLLKAKQMYPQLRNIFLKTKHGRAEALLIAEWGRRHYINL